MAPTRPFVAFEGEVPPAREALDGVYAAFADWPKPTDLACTDCFGEDEARHLLRDVPLESLPPRDVAQILLEHIDCSVGRDGFWHFLPRALETQFFNISIHPDLTAIALFCGLARLEETRAAPLRAAAVRAALGFFRDRNTAPFYDRHDTAGSGAVRWNSYFAGEAGWRLVRFLLALRVEPCAVFQALFAQDGEFVWQTIAHALTKPVWLTNAWRDGDTTFNRLVSDIAWIDFFAVIDAERLQAVDKVLGPNGPRSRRSDAVRAAYAARRAQVDPAERDRLVGALRQWMEAAP